jgi:medium-chain acyl-[acyl-carrier-protein] hydrolase
MSATAQPAAPWIRTVSPRAHKRLFCLPYAGAGAAAFKGWTDSLPATIDVCPVVLPGREHRMREPASADLRALADQLAQALRPLVRRTPYAIYGHSMGSWLGFELVRALRRLRLPAPEHLYVGARRAPHLPSDRPPISDLDRDAFVAAVQDRYQAIPEALLAQPAILDLFLPTLRADFGALDAYRYTEEEPLDVPITAFRGARDTVVPPDGLRAWAQHTRGAFVQHTLPGGHFFLDEDRDLLTSFLSRW